jgi:hypothetical protein
MLVYISKMIQPCQKIHITHLSFTAPFRAGGLLTLADREVLSPARDQLRRNKGFVIGENIL